MATIAEMETEIHQAVKKTLVEGAADMKRINSKLDDSWTRYYSKGNRYPELRKRYDRILGSVEVGPVLDIGCGPGVTVRELTTIGCFAVGLDYSDEIIKIARTHTPNGKFVWGRAEYLPFKDGAFNTVIMTEVLEHVEDVEKAIAEVDRVTNRPAAKIIITVPNGGGTSRAHLRTFDLESLRALLPWRIEELEVMGEHIWCICKKEN